MAARPTPFDLAFASLADERFPRIRAALEAAGRDPGDRDAFLVQPEAVLLLHELRPEEGLGEGIDQLAALLHHAYLFWDSGRPTVVIPDEALGDLLGPAARPSPDSSEGARALYAEFPARRVWADVIGGEPLEPLEGCFVHVAPGGTLRTLGAFGVRPERMGFSVAEVEGPRPEGLARPDGTPLFAPAMAGGGAARVHSLVGAEELLELGWRVRGLAGTAGSGEG